MKKTLFLYLFFIGSLGLMAQEVVAEVQVLNAQEFREAISGKRVQLFDVRTPKEYNEGHISVAVNINYYQKKVFNEAFEEMDMNEPVYLYCRSGKRSNNAAKKLIGMGFTEVYDLKGGFLAWRSEK